MKRRSSTFTLAITLLGVAAGIALAPACGDQSPDRADAATACNCPQAEPPIDRSRLFFVQERVTLAPGERKEVQVECDGGLHGMIPISGGCRPLGSGGKVVLISSGIIVVPTDPPTGLPVWLCTFENQDINPVEVESAAQCLVLGPPAEL